MITTKNINEARKEIQKLVREGKEVVVDAGDDDFNRKIFEIKDVDMVVGLEINGNDRLKQRDSGMNEVIAKLAKSNNIAVGVDVSRIKRLSALEKGKALSRVRQNIGLCKRTRARITILGADKKEAISFVVGLGGSTEMGRNAVSIVAQ
jgi:RNase P/RNase MRP subunit p30